MHFSLQASNFYEDENLWTEPNEPARCANWRSGKLREFQTILVIINFFANLISDVGIKS